MSRLETIEHEMIHIRRRVDHPKRPIEIGRRKVEGHVDAPGDLDLERIARDDVLLHPRDVLQEFIFIVY